MSGSSLHSARFSDLGKVAHSCLLSSLLVGNIFFKLIFIFVLLMFWFWLHLQAHLIYHMLFAQTKHGHCQVVALFLCFFENSGWVGPQFFNLGTTASIPLFLFVPIINIVTWWYAPLLVWSGFVETGLIHSIKVSDVNIHWIDWLIDKLTNLLANLLQRVLVAWGFLRKLVLQSGYPPPPPT